MRIDREAWPRPRPSRRNKDGAEAYRFGSGRVRRWRLLLAVVGVAVAGVAGIGVLGWVGSERWMISDTTDGPPADPGARGLPSEAVTFPSRDATPLTGWYIPAPEAAHTATGDPATSRARGTVVVMHGLRSSSESMVEHAEYLHHGGYNVLLFDFRANGASGEKAVTFGAREQLDALGALDYLEGRDDVDMRRVGFHGVSMGAVVALLVAAHDPRISAVVAEAPFSSFRAVVERSYAHRPPIVRRVQAAATTWMLNRRLAIDIDAISAVRAAADLDGRPILIIEAEFDEQVPPGSAGAIAAAAGESGSLWVVQGATHGAGHQSQPEEFERRVLHFWESAFARGGE